MQHEGAWTTVWPPLSLAFIASIMKKENWDVQLIDCGVEGINIDGLRWKMMEFKPDFIILNTATPTIVSDLSVTKLAKEVSPNAKVACFGIHVSVFPEESFHMAPGLDYVVRGEPEFTFKELARSMKEEGVITKISGLSYQDGGVIVNNPDREFIDELDELPFPAWHLITPNRYRLPFSGRPFLLITPVRGCPYKCIFCAAMTYYGRKLRYHSPERVVEEMNWIKKEFGVGDLLFWSELFNAKKDYVMAVCNEIERMDIKMNWVCSSRVDQVDREMLNKIRRAGCWMISYGFESGCQEILDRSKKETNLVQAREAVRLAKEAGLEVVGHFVFGLPGESRETIRETYKFAEGLGLDYAQFYCAVPFPGTTLYDLACSNGWLSNSNWPEFEQNYSVMNLPGLKATEVMKLRREAYKDFYLRPRRIIRVLKQIKDLNELKRFLKKALNFSTWI
ncbi:MAG: radical SAM protein [Deltaproteobacteria bacterium]|nr:MAG: radical SAM protein [Deltaproteobacteria bacterium]